MVESEELPERSLERDDGTLTVETHRDGDGALVLQLLGELDLASVPTFGAALALAEHDARELVIDLSGLEFVDSSGISQFLAAHERAEREGRRLRFRRGSPTVERILRISGLDQILELSD
jgi:anti-sigma B factor antagonist